jgi:hypothetical protein
LRGVGMTMHDGSYSPDGDVLVQHTDKIICDTNLNGSFADDLQISMTLNGSGDFTYTPTVLAACVLRVYVKEDWGNTATKDYPFTIVNQTPTVQISVKGDMPSPPVVDGVNFNMQDLVNDKARFNAEDHYATSRPSDMYYDSTEQALASPTRSNFLYTSPTSNGFIYSSTGFDASRYLWSGSYGDKYLPMGSRGSKDVWYTVGSSGAFACDSACWTPYGFYFNAFDARTNTARTMSDTSNQRTW